MDGMCMWGGGGVHPLILLCGMGFGDRSFMHVSWEYRFYLLLFPILYTMLWYHMIKISTVIILYFNAE